MSMWAWAGNPSAASRTPRSRSCPRTPSSPRIWSSSSWMPTAACSIPSRRFWTWPFRNTRLTTNTSSTPWASSADTSKETSSTYSGASRSTATSTSVSTTPASPLPRSTCRRWPWPTPCSPMPNAAAAACSSTWARTLPPSACTIRTSCATWPSFLWAATTSRKTLPRCRWRRKTPSR